MNLAAPTCLDARHPLPFDQIPDTPAVFLVWAAEGTPYLGRTALLRRRLKRLFREEAAPSRVLRLTKVAERIEYWTAASRLESSLVQYELARRHYPDDYAHMIRLRAMPMVSLTMNNRFPRTMVTSRLGAGRNVYYGPFRSRANAETFESRLLDFFQIRRCQEDLEPTPDHPGCIYGEMSRCLRPCQAVVGDEEYASEAGRVAEFLRTSGQSLVDLATHARERYSEEMRFEDAAREHARLEKLNDLLRHRDELAGEVERLNGVAITRSNMPASVKLWFFWGGAFTEPCDFSVAATGSETLSLDRRLREAAAALEAPRLSALRRGEHIALLAKWFYSGWRDGEWLPFDLRGAAPYRKMVNAIHRVAALS